MFRRGPAEIKHVCWDPTRLRLRRGEQQSSSMSHQRANLPITNLFVVWLISLSVMSDMYDDPKDFQNFHDDARLHSLINGLFLKVYCNPSPIAGTQSFPSKL